MYCIVNEHMPSKKVWGTAASYENLSVWIWRGFFLCVGYFSVCLGFVVLFVWGLVGWFFCSCLLVWFGFFACFFPLKRVMV